MKNSNAKRFFGLLLCFSAVGLLSTSCGKEGCTDPIASNYDSDAKRYDGSCEYSSASTFEVFPEVLNGVTYKRIAGQINQNYTMNSGEKWLIDGGVFVTSGNTLTIEQCTEIFAMPDGATDFLVISQGAKINAVGTADCPIVMSSFDAQAGAWGGLVINGYGNINTGSTAEAECGSGTYGGTDDADNSGTLQYVRIEYAGLICATDDELNGLTLNAVGSGTTIEHVQTYKCADDGFEFFGGMVSVRWAVSTGAGDDSFDWTHGWRGNGQYWVVVQDPAKGDRGFEGDNNGDDNTATPYSQPKIANITILMSDDGDAENTGMRLREGTKGNIHNAIIVGAPNHGVRVSDAQTTDNMNDNSLVWANSVSFGAVAGDDFKDCPVFLNDATNSNQDPSLSGFVGTFDDTNAADATVLGAWFEAAKFKGAVSSTNNWTAEGTWVRAL